MGTQIDVRVIAKGGKYLGDDIGGALVTVHDVRTGELLAQGTTSGGAGETHLMSVCGTQGRGPPRGGWGERTWRGGGGTRGNARRWEGASFSPPPLDWEEPRLIRVSAYG